MRCGILEQVPGPQELQVEGKRDRMPKPNWCQQRLPEDAEDSPSFHPIPVEFEKPA